MGRLHVYGLYTKHRAIRLIGLRRVRVTELRLVSHHKSRTAAEQSKENHKKRDRYYSTYVIGLTSWYGHHVAWETE